jgi:hypothetical protein
MPEGLDDTLLVGNSFPEISLSETENGCRNAMCPIGLQATVEVGKGAFVHF